MQKTPGRRATAEQRCRLAFPDAPVTEPLGGAAAGCTKARTEPIYHGDRDRFRNAAPLLPAVERAQIVGSHDPDKMDPRAVRYQISDDVVRITYADLGFDAGNLHAGMTGELACRRHALIERSKSRGVLERIAGRDQPAHLVERQSFYGQQASGKMRLVRRIERSSEQPYALAGIMNWNPVTSSVRRGRGCFRAPLPVLPRKRRRISADTLPRMRGRAERRRGSDVVSRHSHGRV